jgi:hypothetical protein
LTINILLSNPLEINPKSLRLQIEQKLTENIIAQAPRNADGNVLLFGIPIRPEDAAYFARLDLQHFQETDQYLRPGEVISVKQRYLDLEELKRINERTNDIIQESQNKGDKKAINYFKDTSNKPTGANSIKPPLKSNDLGTLHYFWHGFFGKGQDIQTDIQNLGITKNQRELQNAFLGKKGYEPDPSKNNPLPKILANFQPNSLPIKVNIPQVKVPTENKGWQENSIGKIKLEAQGVLLSNSKGKPVFIGLLRQGKNSEVFTFPYGGRSADKEVKTWIGRHLLPITNFRTIITGTRPIVIEF